MIEKITNILMDNEIIDRADKDIYDYGLFVIFFNILCLLTIFLLGFLLKQIEFTVMFLMFYIPNRLYLGGYHCKSPISCYIIFNILIIVIIKFHLIINFKNLYYFIIVFFYFWGIKDFIEKNKNRIYSLIMLIIFIMFFLATLINPFLRESFSYAIGLNLILYFIPIELKYHNN